jgi:hypothetical protein
VEEINAMLEAKFIPYLIPEVQFGDRMHLRQVGQRCLQNVHQSTSDNHCAFFLIGESAAFLIEGIRINYPEQSGNIKEEAKAKVQDIQHMCPNLDVVWEPLWQLIEDIVVRTASQNRGEPFLLRGLVNGIRKFLNQPTLQILMLSANPTDQVELQLDKEFHLLSDALKETRFHDRFEINYRPSCRIDDISRAILTFRPNILHFSGHGEKNTGGLVFEDKTGGKAEVVKQFHLASLLAGSQDYLKLVILNSCYSDIEAQYMADKIGNVIAMENKISDTDALNFAKQFYTTLGFCGSIDKSFNQAKAAVYLHPGCTLRPRLFQARPSVPKPILARSFNE